MAGPPFNPPTDPADCFSLSPFGFGPFPEPGEEVLVCPPHPDFTGFGGVGWIDSDPQLESVRGAPYGLASYGRSIASHNLLVDGGYGGSPYGFGPYGSVDDIAPRLASAISLTPWTIQVFFSEEMDPNNPALLDPLSYTLTGVVGAAPATVASVLIGSEGTISIAGQDYLKGVLSVILTHEGTTLGGVYLVGATDITDVAGNTILPVTVSLYTKGEPPAYTVTPTSGDALQLEFQYPLLPTSLMDVASYAFTSEPEYPVTLRAVAAVQTRPNQVSLDIVGQTTLEYTSSVSPAVAIAYNGSVLPSLETSFNGQEINPANGVSSIVAGKLSMERDAGTLYGWSFQDTTGKVVAGSTFRTDVTFDASQAVYDPPLAAFANVAVAQITVEDSLAGAGIQALLTFQRAPGSVDQIRIQSGVYDKTLDVTWSAAEIKISLVRNILAGTYSLLVDDTPVDTTLLANFTQLAVTAPGVSVTLLNEAVSITGFLVSGVKFTASSTVYSTAWNFLHDWQAVFQGNNLLTRDFILTERGPLVKDWGDMTPATKQDVAVRVNGVDVSVKDVNPYVGKITLEIPVPLLPIGDPELDVQCDYRWLATPVMEMAGLNTDGLVLNKWDRNITGFHDNGAIDWTGWDTRDLTSIPYDKRGAPDLSRFPMGVVLGPLVTPQPLLIGHRYMGFVKETSALLNSPTTLLLNQDPSKYDVPGFEQMTQGVTVAFEGTTSPESATPAWSKIGSDLGGVDVTDGTYVVKDAGTGSFESPVPPCAFYQHNEDLSFPASVVLVARYIVDSTTPDGVFTGVGLGLHDDKRLYLVGNLVVNGVQHVGMLQDARNPHLLGSWQIGPKVQAAIQTATTAQLQSSLLPTSLRVGNRFQILAPHSQTGVYTITHLVRQSDGKTTVTVSPAFPAEPNKWGNKYPDVLFETLWEGKPSTYRLTLVPDKANTGRKQILLSMSGLTSTFVTEFTDPVTELPLPAESSLALYLGQDVGTRQKAGAVFWGSLSYHAVNESSWSFIRYAVSPDETAIRGHAKTALTDMSVVPEAEADQAWFLSEAFGYSKVQAGELYLKATSANAFLNTSFGYTRNEPFFGKASDLDLTAIYRVDTGVRGAGDAEILLNDSVREVRVSTLMYYEDNALDPYRQLVSMPVVSFTGLLPLQEQGWVKIQDANAGAAGNHENDLVLDQVTGQPTRYQQVLGMANLVAPDSGNRVFEMQLAVDPSYTVDAGTGETGIFMGADSGVAAAAGIAVSLCKVGGVSKVRLVKLNNFAVVQEVSFDWADGGLHTYRVVTSDVAVTLFLDEVSQPVQAVADFAGQGSGLHRCLFGVRASGGQGQIRWRSLSYSVLPHGDVRRTLGVWLGGDKDSIDSWEIPRTDATSAANSEEIGPVIEEMDWRAQITVRVLRTSNWGVTVFRPDMPLPPYYQAEAPGVPGSGYTLPNLEVSAGWINVEYANLPYVPRGMGYVGFGSFEPRSVTQQRWESIAFKISKTPTDDWRAPQHMVLNQHEVVTSGELLRDETLESVVTSPLPGNDGYRRVSLLPTHLFANDIYKVIDGNTIYTSESWTFDPDSQLLTLNTLGDGTPVVFSGNPLTVLFYPGDRITDTYLLAQPLLDSMTLLNEGTPPFPKSQDKDDQADVVGGVRIFERGTEILTQVGFDGSIQQVEGPPALYENMRFLSVDDGGWTSLITTVGEGFLPAGFTGYTTSEGDQIYDNTGAWTGDFVGESVGTHVIKFKGTVFTEQALAPKKASFEQGGGMPGKVFMASGGNFMGPVVDGMGKVIGQKPLGGTLGPGTALLYPNAPSRGLRAGTDAGARNRENLWYLRNREMLTTAVPAVGQVLDETLTSPSDATPPSLPQGWEPNPNGAQVATGAALAVLYVSGNYSHIGPWGGISALSAEPGSGMTQKSTLAGGAVSLVGANHDPLKGMVLQGGAQLPQGTVTVLILG